MISAVAFACIFVSILLTLIHLRRTRNQYPPGPPGLPIIGNLHKLPVDWRWMHEGAMAKKYGDVVHYSSLGVHVITINSYKALRDLLVYKGRLYNDRPDSPMLAEMDHRLLVTERYGQDWATHRKIFLDFMKPASIRKYWDSLEFETRQAVLRIHEAPENFYGEIPLLIVKHILGMTYDYHDIHSTDDPMLPPIDRAVEHAMAAINPAQFLTTSFPWLKYFPKWFPGGSDVSIAQVWAAEDEAAYGIPFEWAKKEIAGGRASQSFVMAIYEGAKERGQVIDDRDVRGLAGAMYAAGAATSMEILHGFTLAMTLHPEVQAKAREELDSIVGRDRLANLEDMPKLKYINAIMDETLRWWSIVPTGTPRMVMEDNYYRNWLIPKGTQVVMNTWAISRDENEYVDPETFDPDRFYIPNEKGEFPLNPRQYIFAVGRRNCAGTDLALAMMFLFISTLLQTTIIEKAKDENGGEITPDTFPDHLTRTRPHCKPFRCAMVPREGLIQQLLTKV